MYFRDRVDAGKKLSQELAKYKGQDVVVYALPRGGVVVAEEIAKALHAPLDLVLAHKIGHPYHSEYAIGAISESGIMVGNQREISQLDPVWLEKAKKSEMEEIKRKREAYLKGRKPISPEGKIAILVDDGIATGLTMQVGILELKTKHPMKIVAAVPVAPASTADLLGSMCDDLVACDIPDDFEFLGAVGAYYDRFDQVEDEEVIEILNKHKSDYGKVNSHKS